MEYKLSKTLRKIRQFFVVLINYNIPFPKKEFEAISNKHNAIFKKLKEQDIKDKSGWNGCFRKSVKNR